MKNWIIILSAIATISTISACKKSEAPKEQTKSVFVLVDYSESVKDARKDYIDAFRKIISEIKTGDHIFVWKITELSEMETKPLFDENFPFPPPAKNEFYWKQAMAKAEKEMKAKLNEIEKKMEALLNSEEQLSKRTAILGSLQIAERVFKKDRKDKRILVIMSDMIEDSSEYNFERERLSDKRTAEIIGIERSKKSLPDLSGVTVYVIGAKAQTREQFNNIQNFWLRYFKECGASLPKENYGSTLLGFNE